MRKLGEFFKPLGRDGGARGHHKCDEVANCHGVVRIASKERVLSHEILPYAGCCWLVRGGGA